jgi:hypothetical protein
MAYAQLSSGAPAGGEQPDGGTDPSAEGGAAGGPGPAQSSGRLWVPGQ